MIVTAAFGEGHNSAARNISQALRDAGAETLVSDPCSEGAPHLTDAVSRGYRVVTTHFPKFWAKIYASTDRQDFSKPRTFVLDYVAKALARKIDDFRPDALVSTYPLYPYFLADMPGGKRVDLPLFTIVTDSMEINATWLKAPTDFFLVTDPATKAAMAERGVPEEKIIDTGFAVAPVFSRLEPVPGDDPCDPFRVLYFPTAKLQMVRRHARAVLDASPRTRLTYVLGRNFRHLASRALEIRAEYPGRVRILGWTRKVPQLLSGHHLVIGKAGGATVHEAIAARCPMFIHHLVPGQEEGNLRLLEKIGAGKLAEGPEEIRASIAGLLAENAAGWRGMKRALAGHGRNSGAITAARFVLDQACARRH